ncbi:MAG: helix-turn-helix transcriptional regulator [Ottowia sp.]|uniref:ArsR/SmtB family transcription factor n=1 Tax=Ottowia beijingensis TaxID=1207057 RepID=UPI001B4E2DB9|nr:helix-turn-helix transcriptional regulator [Ottowia sp.]MBP7531206.1 helix-turn-helix transcriptional regulator [Ottowia sp.]MBP7538068.1 helix-turn-helix transcriptional regulator [Ottowia sp.]HRL36884.1 helix-turn-helix domain-containing protein [Ottowia beijingensis]
MERAAALLTLESLSSGIRLDIFRLLVRQGPEGLVAGEIATALELAPSNLSFHLKALTQSGLLSVEQEGRYQRYRANMPLMLDLIAYLTEECCAGHPELCGDLPTASSCAPARRAALADATEA